MTKNQNSQTKYTANLTTYQQHLPLFVEAYIPDDDPVHLVRYMLERMDLTPLYKTYSHIEKNKANPRQLLAVILYANMEGIHSSRKIETRCKRDMNYKYLLEDAPAPDYTTIARFRSLHLEPCVKEIFANHIQTLIERKEVSLANLFIDGTKIEANANRYTFVWKKAVTKHVARLGEKIAVLVEEIEAFFGIRVVWQGQVRPKHLKQLLKKLYALKEKENIVFVYGSGKRKSSLQRAIEKLEAYRAKLKEYGRHLHICGERNSYAKTDHDATFMRMKEDHMRNGQLKAGYNIQFGVDAEYITWVTVSHHPNDTRTLIPFLKDMEEHLKLRYPNIVADAGYESEENYLHLEESKQTGYIKTSHYEQRKTRKYKQDIGRWENMLYVEEGDYYICAEGKKLVAKKERIRKTHAGFRTTTTQYVCENCTGCTRKAECIKGNHSKTPLEERTKQFEMSKVFQKQREESLARITSEKGIELRVNRSIQAEGAFAYVKEDLLFRRFLGRGKGHVTVEIMLLAMAHNVNKLHHRTKGGRLGQYLFPVEVAA